MTNDQMAAEIVALKKRVDSLTQCIDATTAQGLLHAARLKVLIEALATAATTTGKESSRDEFEAALDAGVREQLAKFLLDVGDTNPPVAEFLRKLLEGPGILPPGYLTGTEDGV